MLHKKYINLSVYKYILTNYRTFKTLLQAYITSLDALYFDNKWYNTFNKFLVFESYWLTMRQRGVESCLLKWAWQKLYTDMNRDMDTDTNADMCMEMDIAHDSVCVCFRIHVHRCILVCVRRCPCQCSGSCLNVIFHTYVFQQIISGHGYF